MFKIINYSENNKPTKHKHMLVLYIQIHFITPARYTVNNLVKINLHIKNIID